jgi:thymidylate synthase ThyX
MHFLEQRLKSEAQYEIRRYAEAVRDLVSEDMDQLGIGEDT